MSDALADLFPVHQRHTPDTIRDAGRAVAHLARHLAHGTFQHGQMSPADASALVADLTIAAETLGEVLDRLSNDAYAAATDPDPHDVVRVDRARALADASGELRQAATASHRMADHLRAADFHLARVTPD